METTTKRQYRLALGLLALFILLACIYQTESVLALEKAVQAGVEVIRQPGLTAAARVVSWFCNPSTIVVLCLLMLAIPPIQRTIGGAFVAGAAGAGLLNQILKALFARPRPDSLFHLITEHGYSFPSGHSMASGAIGVVLLWGALRYIRPGPVRRIACALGALFPLLVGVSRIYLGVHYAVDVLAGWSSGVATGLLIVASWDRIAGFAFRRQGR